eukprot:CAMPEP_0194511794 /NCGR_PEP_ID=MMETSP0253-20130528/43567_1 /TAXON_ID=2966 /ORGANISM="Noctiluca scintillans" /LENGTH=33 /DNA_ID= /DNA_START= /DNA_END= /DNA_ORIENTATION=
MSAAENDSTARCTGSASISDNKKALQKNDRKAS